VSPGGVSRRFGGNRKLDQLGQQSIEHVTCHQPRVYSTPNPPPPPPPPTPPPSVNEDIRIINDATVEKKDAHAGERVP
jgi:hypothetical protein